MSYETPVKDRQVYGKSELYWFIGTQPNEETAQKYAHMRCMINHPFTHMLIKQEVAKSYIVDVSQELQEILHHERQLLDLPLEDEHPMTKADEEIYETTMRLCRERCWSGYT
jgi:hypothetical protein